MNVNNRQTAGNTCRRPRWWWEISGWRRCALVSFSSWASRVAHRLPRTCSRSDRTRAPNRYKNHDHVHGGAEKNRRTAAKKPRNFVAAMWRYGKKIAQKPATKMRLNRIKCQRKGRITLTLGNCKPMSFVYVWTINRKWHNFAVNTYELSLVAGSPGDTWFQGRSQRGAWGA